MDAIHLIKNEPEAAAIFLEEARYYSGFNLGYNEKGMLYKIDDQIINNTWNELARKNIDYMIDDGKPNTQLRLYANRGGGTFNNSHSFGIYIDPLQINEFKRAFRVAGQDENTMGYFNHILHELFHTQYGGYDKNGNFINRLTDESTGPNDNQGLVVKIINEIRRTAGQSTRPYYMLNENSMPIILNDGTQLNIPFNNELVNVRQVNKTNQYEE